MLTAKGKYGLKAMVHLAKADEGRLTLSEEIASSHAISKKFLDAILGSLRAAGLVETRKGRGGGYRLASAPAAIRVGHILRVLDGPLAPISCASRTAYRRCDDCHDAERCEVRLVMLTVRNAISDILDRQSLADLVAIPALLEMDKGALALELTDGPDWNTRSST